jgi:hypothetical protein
MALRDWSLSRVIALSILWILGVIIVFLEWGVALACRFHVQQPSAEFCGGVVSLPGGFWTLFAPPALLVMAWLALRRSRPAS